MYEYAASCSAGQPRLSGREMGSTMVRTASGASSDIARCGNLWELSHLFG